MNNCFLRSWIEVDINALVQNMLYGKNKTGVKAMCVIKGDAHGHGAVQCGLILQENGADAFAVACLSEAISLRKGGITKPILILGWTPPMQAQELNAYNLTQSILDEDYARALNAAAESNRIKIQVHIKLDTGMTRTGLFAQNYPKKAAEAIIRISHLSSLNIAGIFTHFAAADMPEKDVYTAWQLSNFHAVLNALNQRGFVTSKIVCHAANSACVMNHPDTWFDMVRMGVMLYGLYPDGIFRENGPLKQALTLKARVVQVRDVPAGVSISYGCTAITKKETRIAVVSAGYADSYPRSLSNKGAYAVIRGHNCPQLGRICMDMCMFDVTGSDVQPGDEAILYGKGGMSLEKVAELAGSINCEPTSLLTNRVQKLYVK